MATYVVSDIHGYGGLFEKMLETINFSESDFLYVLGDAIDRGPDGIAILEKIMDSDNMDLLIGNHEFMMLTSIDTDTFLPSEMNADLWIWSNGGSVTCKSFIMLSDDRKTQLLKWLWTRKLSTVVSAYGVDYCLTHTCFMPEMMELLQ